MPLSDIIGDVPGISMKGISKEFPWPGSRCGWMEIYNADKDAAFARYIDAILTQKMSEVCSTTLPQMAIPRIMSHPEYRPFLDERIRHYEKLSNIAYKILKDLPYVMVNRTCGAFYMTVVFNDAVLNSRQFLPIAQDEIRTYIEKLVAENDRVRQALRLLPAGSDRDLRDPADLLLHRPARFPDDPPGEGRSEVRAGGPDAGREDRRLRRIVALSGRLTLSASRFGFDRFIQNLAINSAVPTSSNSDPDERRLYPTACGEVRIDR